MTVQESRQGLSRRSFLGWAGLGTTAVGAAALGATVGAKAAGSADPAAEAGAAYEFFGEHQSGIVTPAQDRLHFAAFDLTTDRVSDVTRLLRDWSLAAQQLMSGSDMGAFGATSGPYDAPPQDTGEAVGLPASGLTLTFGFGPGIFRDAKGRDRFGLADRRPAALIDLPHFPGDNLEPGRCGGDLCVQACANDPQVAVHAVRNLARIAFGTAAIRWSQLGFGRTSSTSSSQTTPRNLFGFKDGTANIKAEEQAALDDHVWVGGSDQPAWMHGGSYLVARRIRMTIETWDRTSLREQEDIIGRAKGSGAPLSGGEEFTEPDFAAMGSGPNPLIRKDSHVALAHPSHPGNSRILRRGYNFVDGNDGLGRLEAGLFFLAYQRDIRTGFLPVQKTLAASDSMNEYIQHVGSAAFAIPPGVTSPGGWVGESLFGSG